MEEHFWKKLRHNGLVYQRSLDRIIAKYSMLQDQDGGIEVDLNTTNMSTLKHYKRLSQMKLNELECMSQADSREESIESQHMTRDSQLDLSHHEERGHKMSTNLFSDQDNALSKKKSSETTLRLWDESQGNSSAMEIQPEDEDDEQEMSPRSEGSSLADLYPNTITQIGRVWRRQHVSEAADSVRKRYRIWRRPSNKSNLSMISNTTLRKTSSKSNKTNRETQIKKTIESPLKKHLLGNQGAEAAYLSSVRTDNPGKYCQTQRHHHSPGKGTDFKRKEQPPPVLVLDLSSCSFEDILCQNTFIIPHPSPQKSQPPAYTLSPSKPCYPTAKAQDASFRPKGFSVSPIVKKIASFSLHSSKSPVSKEKPDVYGSPVRYSPFKARLAGREGRGGVPHAFSVSPKSYTRSYTQEPMRSVPTSLLSPPKTSPAAQRMLHYQDSRPIVQSQVRPPPSSAAAERHRLRRRCLSFDSSSLSPSRVSYSAKELDDDFISYYHKFVCQSKPPLMAHLPCRMCGKNSAASRGHSSSDLAAPALSSHRSLLRKRYKVEKMDDHP